MEGDLPGPATVGEVVERDVEILRSCTILFLSWFLMILAGEHVVDEVTDDGVCMLDEDVDNEVCIVRIDVVGGGSHSRGLSFCRGQSSGRG